MKNFLKISIALLILISVSCSMDGDISSDFTGGSGTGGSMARFTVLNNHLYTVDNSSLNVYDINTPEKPRYLKKTELAFTVETIFPFNSNLFLGTTNGMYVFDASLPANPSQISFFQHTRSCDPVVTDGKFAYVSLNTASINCGRIVNELQIVDINDIKNPILVKTLQMESPRGLAIRNDTLWVCDKGLKVFNVANKQTPLQINYFTDLTAYDIILNKNLALVVGETGFVQYKLEKNSIKKLSEIKINL